jgi:hypothetical protein
MATNGEFTPNSEPTVSAHARGPAAGVLWLDSEPLPSGTMAMAEGPARPAENSEAPPRVSLVIPTKNNAPRFMGGGVSRDITRTRRIGNLALPTLVNRLYHAQLTDLCYGFCAFHRRYLPFLNITTTGFEVETQLIISALGAGLPIAEVPSMEMPRRYSRSNLRTFRDGARVLRTILRERCGHSVLPSGTHHPYVPSNRFISGRAGERQS